MKLSGLPIELQRRQWLKSVLFGAGGLGLRSLACGVPRSVLAAPLAFLQRTTDDEARQLVAEQTASQFLVLSGSDDGDPLNGNVPGTYDDPKILHSTLPSMAPTTFSLGENVVKGAQVWSSLPAEILAQTCFFHGMTTLIGHGEFNSAHTLKGAIADRDVLASTLAKKTATPLKTLQPQPLNISGRGGTEAITFLGAPQPTFSPNTIAGLLRAPDASSKFGATLSLRDRDLDAINAVFAARATPAQKQLLDSWATSQAQARTISADVATELAEVKDNSVDAQLLAALLLFRLKVTPVAYVHLPFGGDNHVDPAGELGPGPLSMEVAQTQSTVASLTKFYAKATSLGLGGKVTVATIDTFGRSNAWGLTGRAHNRNHVVNLLIGANVRGAQVGGVSLKSGELVGQPIDSRTGAAAAGGDIAADSTLASFGKTLGRAVGLNASVVDEMITDGKAVQAALVSA